MRNNQKEKMTPKRWKPMDVAFADNLNRPRNLILEVSDKYEQFRYTTCSESGGSGCHSESSLMTLEEWLKWLERFSDDLTGRQMREAREAVMAPFTEPKFWTAFRERFAATGDPWLKQ
jgi:hypothetical protein